jgi:predicted nucleic-acid-binding Zn-ribbon protein
MQLQTLIQEFIKLSSIKRDVSSQLNKSKILKYFIITGVLFFTTLIISLNSNSTSLFVFSYQLATICGIFICIYLLKEKIRLNNLCPQCGHNNSFNPLTDSKKTTVSYSVDKSIHERGLDGKYIGKYQDGTVIDGAKYEIKEYIRKDEETYYDWHCSNCEHLENYKEHFSHFIYILGILLGIIGLFCTVTVL